ncbi:hypothetical protein [Pantoea vagans]|uniref:hypothetical protein n=1 Tax=Pantoea vagans TaxID=470934 RepID=UPI001D00D11D|nr:hypothetical protein [Pantoea vagans]
MIRTSVSTVMAWVFLCFTLLIAIIGGIIWFQGSIITSRLSDIDSYSQQLASLKAKAARTWRFTAMTRAGAPTWWWCRSRR